MQDSILYILQASIVLIFLVIAIDIYFLIKTKMTKKKIDNIERSLRAKDEEMTNVLQSLKNANVELNRIKEEVNKIKVLKK
jgi:Tfp pilus assembly protein PilO